MQHVQIIVHDAFRDQQLFIMTSGPQHGAILILYGINSIIVQSKGLELGAVVPLKYVITGVCVCNVIQDGQLIIEIGWGLLLDMRLGVRFALIVQIHFRAVNIAIEIITLVVRNVNMNGVHQEQYKMLEEIAELIDMIVNHVLQNSQIVRIVI